MQNLEGPIRISSRGFGYFSLPDDPKRTVKIDPGRLNTALPGDRVLVRLGPAIGAEFSGEVIRVLERRRLVFVGVLSQEKDFYFVEPDNRQIYVDILVNGPDLRGARPGDKVVVRLNEWRDPKKEPLGEIIKVIGRAGDHETEMEAIVYEQGFEPTFAAEIEEAAALVARRAEKELPAEIARRRDLRMLPTFTIDPEDAKDFDDALSFRRLENGNLEVGVHIADVSHFVRPGSKLDAEARRRATSIYLVDRTIPMLPEILSNNLCSLNPGEEKLVFSALFRFDQNHRLHDQWFGKAVIRSDHRFTYEEAQRRLDRGEGKFAPELAALWRLTSTLRQERVAAGALAFDDEEIKFSLDSLGRPIAIKKKMRHHSNLLVEELMLLANRQAALLGTKLAKPRKEGFVYRVHDRPNRDKIKQLADFVWALGFQLSVRETQKSARALTILLRAAAGRPEADLIQTAALQTMAKAVYSTKNIGHYGLAITHYTHFTSPIRRYPDLLVHRLLELYQSGRRPEQTMLEECRMIADHSSQMEASAQQAEWDSIKYKQVEYLQNKLGHRFDGVISGLATWGIFVEELSTLAEGLVRVSELKDDYYVFDEKNYALVGRRSKKRYRLGDKVRVKLLRADPKTRQLDFAFV